MTAVVAQEPPAAGADAEVLAAQPAAAAPLSTANRELSTSAVTPLGRWSPGEPARLRLTGAIAASADAVHVVVGPAAARAPARILSATRSPDGSTLVTLLLPAVSLGDGTVDVTRGTATASAAAPLVAPAGPGALVVTATPFGPGTATVTVTVVAGGARTDDGPVELFFVPPGDAPITTGEAAVVLPPSPDGTWTGTVSVPDGAGGVIARAPTGVCSGTAPIPLSTPVPAPIADPAPADGPAGPLTGDTWVGPIVFPGDTHLDSDWTFGGGATLRTRIGGDWLAEGDRLEAGVRIGYAGVDVPREVAIREEFVIISGGEPYVLTGTAVSGRLTRLGLIFLTAEATWRGQPSADGVTPYASLGVGMLEIVGDVGRATVVGRAALGVEYAVAPRCHATFEVGALAFHAPVLARRTTAAFSAAVGLRFGF